MLPILKGKFSRQHVAYPPRHLFLRAFKHEGELEMWASNHATEPYKLIDRYKICKNSGTLGPKRQQGDRQVPEGIYTIDLFNPRSAYHLSMRVSYPNRSDRLRGRRGQLGGAIMVHGSCVTIGCLPIEDGPIEEVFVATKDASRRGKVPIHIFPVHMTTVGMHFLERLNPKSLSFWRELEPIYLAFETTRVVPSVRVDSKTGRYILSKSLVGKR